MKNHLKIYKTSQNIYLCFEHRVLYCLKRERDISIKPILGGLKTAFRCTPALREELFPHLLSPFT